MSILYKARLISGPFHLGDPLGDVVELDDFKLKRPEWVFECPCGSQLFFLHHDGTVECRSCKHIRESIQWTYREGFEPK